MMKFRPASLINDALVTLLFAALTGSLLQPALLSSADFPTGGDTASHLLYAWTFSQEIFPSGHLTAWMPEVFGGFPLLSYYFPLPFIATALLSNVLGFAAAFKWAMVLPSLLLPGTVFAVSRHVLGFRSLAAFCGALGSFAFLLHEQNSIWGGNLLGLMAGEFSYSWGMWFSFITLAAWVRAARLGSGWVGVAILEALTGFCHGYPLLVTGFASCFLLLDSEHRQRTFLLLLKGHLLAFMLLGGWLWPLIAMHGSTIPNDGSAHVSWIELLPKTMWPILGGGLLALAALARPGMRRLITPVQMRTMLFFAATVALASCAWLGADRVGLADIRFFPFVWLFGSILSGWLAGSLLIRWPGSASQSYLALAALFGLLGWLAPLTVQAPDWALWNHSGLASKPQWHVLSGLFPKLAGHLDSPRLLFEHDPANDDLGSTRVLEALPMFLGGRPVLEGLYMESAILGPEIYQMQSEVSARPSSPLVRFPSGSLDPEMAALHMSMLNANEVLLRSPQAKEALRASGLFEAVAEAPPFAVMRLKEFDNRLVDGSPRPWVVKPPANWMQDSYNWFRSRKRLAAEWPVYAADAAAAAFSFPQTRQAPVISALALDRHSISFTTSAPGQPHLIKMAYHPRWQLETKGEVYLAAPGFLMVVPGEASVRLVYGSTWVDRAGQTATIVALLYVLFRAPRRRQALIPAASEVATIGIARWGAAIGVMALLGAWLHATSAERIYFKGWEEMSAKQFTTASELFLTASQRRRSPAAQEEALFWSAKTIEQAGDSRQAISRYRELFDHYTGFWVPESLYTYARLNREIGNVDLALPAETRLQEEYPKSSWTQRMKDELAGK